MYIFHIVCSRYVETLVDRHTSINDDDDDDEALHRLSC